jgi:hypothetical protein
MTVYSKLVEVQNKLKAPKSQFNSFGKYNYRNAEDILEAVKPILKEVGATTFLKDEIVMIGDRYYLKTIAIFVDIETGEKIEVEAMAREAEEKKGMDSAQVTGATSSYARKYALNGLFLIDDTKDNDHDTLHKTDVKKEAALKISQTQIDSIVELMEKTKSDLKGFLGYFKIKEIPEMTAKQAIEGIKMLEKKIKTEVK